MAITHNLPLKDWYYDTTHEGTLDYPPLFAAFELVLATLAHLFRLDSDDELLLLSESRIRSDNAIFYQKITVILSDFLYYFAVFRLSTSLNLLVDRPSSPSTQQADGVKLKEGANDVKTSNDKVNTTDSQIVRSNEEKKASNKFGDQKQVVDTQLTKIRHHLADALYRPDSSSCVALLLLFQPGLLLVDHIHFQYNGFLSAILLLSIANILEGNHLWGGFWFCILLNLKHIYLYLAPAYGMYLLASYCLVQVKGRNRLVSFIVRASRLGSIVIVVFLVTYLPFARDLETLNQIVQRLFPFKRGLTHAYWAPNVWSLYNCADKLLASFFKDSLVVTFDMDSISRTRKVSSTSGLVEEFEHKYLPSVKPVTTFVLVGLTTMPLAIKYLMAIDRKAPQLFMKGLALTAFNSFMFGWHVHEKAIIMVLLPFVPVCIVDPALKATYLRLSLAGTYSLFPLLFEAAEYPTKVCLLISYAYIAKSYLKKPDSHSKLYTLIDNAYLLLLFTAELYTTFIFGRLDYGWNPMARLNKLEYLPLMSTSVLSALGITLSYIELYYNFLVTPLDV